MTQERLGVSIPSDLVAWVRSEASRRDVPQSQIVAEALRLRKVANLRAEIIEGLTQNAAWHQEMVR